MGAKKIIRSTTLVPLFGLSEAFLVWCCVSAKKTLIRWYDGKTSGWQQRLIFDVSFSSIAPQQSRDCEEEADASLFLLEKDFFPFLVKPLEEEVVEKIKVGPFDNSATWKIFTTQMHTATTHDF